MIEKTFGMIKPEGMEHATDIEARILATGLQIEAKREVVLSEDQFERIYGHAKANIPEVYEAMKDYMTSNPVIVVQVVGEDARDRLLKLRGCSNPADAEPGTIRGDYAKDQDYRTLYAQRKFAKNVFHAADIFEAEVMINSFFGGQE